MHISLVIIKSRIYILESHIETRNFLNKEILCDFKSNTTSKIFTEQHPLSEISVTHQFNKCAIFLLNLKMQSTHLMM